jgi:hypothetical protein
MAANRSRRAIGCFLIALLVALAIIPIAASADPIGVGPPILNTPYIFLYTVLATILLNFPINLFMVSFLIAHYGRKTGMRLWDKWEGDPSASSGSTRLFLFMVGTTVFYITALGAVIDAFIALFSFEILGVAVPNLGPPGTVGNIVIGGAIGVILIYASIYACLRSFLHIDPKISRKTSGIIALVNPIAWAVLLIFASYINLAALAIVSIVFLALSTLVLLRLRRLHEGRPQEEIPSAVSESVETRPPRERQKVVVNLLTIAFILAIFILPLMTVDSSWTSRHPQPSPYAYISLVKSSTQSNYTFTANSVASKNPVVFADVVVIIKNQNGVTGFSGLLSTMPTAMGVEGVAFSDNLPLGYLTAGDSFSMARLSTSAGSGVTVTTLYGIGSTIALTNADGAIMASYTV